MEPVAPSGSRKRKSTVPLKNVSKLPASTVGSNETNHDTTSELPPEADAVVILARSNAPESLLSSLPEPSVGVFPEMTTSALTSAIHDDSCGDGNDFGQLVINTDGAKIENGRSDLDGSVGDSPHESPTSLSNSTETVLTCDKDTFGSNGSAVADTAHVLQIAAQKDSDGQKNGKSGESASGIGNITLNNTLPPIRPGSVVTVTLNGAAMNPSIVGQTQRYANALFSKDDSDPDYGRFIEKFETSVKCGADTCRLRSLWEHYHCKECPDTIMVRREEMIRHYKWHKKRAECLALDFLRFGAQEDCQDRFLGCIYRLKQTHYHCLQPPREKSQLSDFQPDCDKVYTNTSDVQNHNRYHLRNNSFLSEGFSRFKRGEDCRQQDCAFFKQFVTHYHCIRCQFAFRIRGEMEKHKAYHMRDDALNRDGFKKYMKTQSCDKPACQYSGQINHIHCLRPGCTFVAQSSSQLASHKQKHDKQAALNSPTTMNSAPANGIANSLTSTLPSGLNPILSSLAVAASAANPATQTPSDIQSVFKMLNAVSEGPAKGLATPQTSTAASTQQATANLLSLLGLSPQPQSTSAVTLAAASLANGSDNISLGQEDSASNGVKTETKAFSMKPLLAEKTAGGSVSAFDWREHVIRYTANDSCRPMCEMLYKEHFHCKQRDCSALFKNREGIKEHAELHVLQDSVSVFAFELKPRGPCSQCQVIGEHYHCLWPNCQLIGLGGDNFKRLDHYNKHAYAEFGLLGKAALEKSLNFMRTNTLRAGRMEPFENISPQLQTKSSTAMDLTVNGGGISACSSQSASPLSCTSSSLVSSSSNSSIRRRGRPPKSTYMNHPKVPHPLDFVPATNQKYQPFGPNTCPDEFCSYRSSDHYHCLMARCYHATDRLEIIQLHITEFHSNLVIVQGFEFFDNGTNCRRPTCQMPPVTSATPGSPASSANQPGMSRPRHFHCVREGCFYTFIRPSTMENHAVQKHGLSYNDLYKDTGLPKQKYPTNFPVALGGGSSSFLTPMSPLKSSSSTSTIGNSQSDTINALLRSIVANASPRNGSSTSDKSTESVQALVGSLIGSENGNESTSDDETSSLNNESADSQACPESTTQMQYMLLETLLKSRLAAAAVNAARGIEKTTDSRNGNTMASTNTVKPTEQLGLNPHVRSLYFSGSSSSVSSSTGAGSDSTAGIGLGAGSSGNNTSEPFLYEGNCGRPFCKLKKKMHFHCDFCEQGFADQQKFTVHVQRHNKKSKAAPFGNLMGPTNIQLPPQLPPPPATMTPADHPSKNNTGDSNMAWHKADLKASQPPLAPPDLPEPLKSESSSPLLDSPSLQTSTQKEPSYFERLKEFI